MQEPPRPYTAREILEKIKENFSNSRYPEDSEEFLVELLEDATKRQEDWDLWLKENDLEGWERVG